MPADRFPRLAVSINSHAFSQSIYAEQNAQAAQALRKLVAGS